MEADSKIKRGRPAFLNTEYFHILAGMFPEATTRRGRENIYYRQLATNVLMKEDRFLWICDPAKMRAGTTGAWRPAILSELGRIKDCEIMKALALRICELKPKTKEAVSIIRNFRLGERKPDAGRLSSEIIRTINSYIERFPTVTNDEIQQSMNDALSAAMDRKE
jgi:hypothetical protein